VFNGVALRHIMRWDACDVRVIVREKIFKKKCIPKSGKAINRDFGCQSN
jgi:hypothetical protein